MVCFISLFEYSDFSQFVHSFFGAQKRNCDFRFREACHLGIIQASARRAVANEQGCRSSVRFARLELKLQHRAYVPLLRSVPSLIAFAAGVPAPDCRQPLEAWRSIGFARKGRRNGGLACSTKPSDLLHAMAPALKLADRIG
jgi:hypothetical protein